MGVHSDFFPGAGHGFRILVVQPVDLLAIEVTEAIDDDHHVGVRALLRKTNDKRRKDC
jgi:ABC-type lipoprotein export system ATPase subunit